MNYCEKRGRDDLHICLNQCVSTEPVEILLVHSSCCRDFTDKKRLGVHSDVLEVEAQGAKRVVISSPFNWKEDCMFCGKSAIFDARHPERQPVTNVSTIPMQCNLLQCCRDRGDPWASEFENHLQG